MSDNLTDKERGLLDTHREGVNKTTGKKYCRRGGCLGWPCPTVTVLRELNAARGRIEAVEAWANSLTPGSKIKRRLLAILEGESDAKACR